MEVHFGRKASHWWPLSVNKWQPTPNSRTLTSVFGENEVGENEGHERAPLCWSLCPSMSEFPPHITRSFDILVCIPTYHFGEAICQRMGYFGEAISQRKGEPLVIEFKIEFC